MQDDPPYKRTSHRTVARRARGVSAFGLVGFRARRLSAQSRMEPPPLATVSAALLKPRIKWPQERRPR